MPGRGGQRRQHHGNWCAARRRRTGRWTTHCSSSSARASAAAFRGGKAYRGTDVRRPGHGHITVGGHTHGVRAASRLAWRAVFGVRHSHRDALAVARSGASPALAESVGHPGALSARDVGDAAAGVLIDAVCARLIADGGVGQVGNGAGGSGPLHNHIMIVVAAVWPLLGTLLPAEIRESLPAVTTNGDRNCRCDAESWGPRDGSSARPCWPLPWPTAVRSSDGGLHSRYGSDIRGRDAAGPTTTLPSDSSRSPRSGGWRTSDRAWPSAKGSRIPEFA